MIATLELSLPHSSIARIAMANASVANDDELAIARTLKGDFNAFNELVLKYQQFAYSVAYRMLQTKELAADAVQDSFLKAFSALRSFRGGSFKSWLIRIVVNTCYDSLRLERRLPTEGIREEPSYDDNDSSFHPLIDRDERPQAFVERMELSTQIELGLRSLPAEQRLVLALCDIHGYGYDEISQITGMAIGTVKSRISRARLKLREFLLLQPELLPAGLSSQSRHW
jgi:RNA polymerase sigma-70 factor, ECF subfamily